MTGCTHSHDSGWENQLFAIGKGHTFQVQGETSLGGYYGER